MKEKFKDILRKLDKFRKYRKLFQHLTSEKNKKILKATEFSMLPYQRLEQMWNLAELQEDLGINGVFIELGCWKGGCPALMAYVSKIKKSERKTYAIDSFMGFPEPTNKDTKKKDIVGIAKANIKDAENARRSLGVDKNMIIIKGWVEDLIPKIKDNIKEIAILRLDMDLYEPTKVCLKQLYPLVVRGGFVVIDDYGYKGWEGCKKAVDEYFEGKKVNLISFDKTERYIMKT